jgi:hypothetical protein
MSFIIVQGIVKDTKIWQRSMSRSKTKNEIDSKSGSKDSYLYYDEGSKSLWYFLWKLLEIN